MGKNHGRADGIQGNRVGDDVGGKYRQHLITEPLKETALQRLMNWAVALLLIYLLGHIIYVLWSEL